jgi:acetyltransferase-like isoleucine patch superfamily enzyme
MIKASFTRLRNAFRHATDLLVCALTQLRWKWCLGELGSYARIGRCRRIRHPRAIAIGSCTRICGGWSISDLSDADVSPELKVRIGDWCIIMDDFQCNAAESVEIHNNCLIASRVFITDSDHTVCPSETIRTTLRRRLITKPVVIENDCWIGQNAVILKGVRVGHHSIVGANAVVTRDVPPYTIVGGIPAKRIGTVGSTEGACNDNSLLHVTS